jgi:hypothetical protein
MTPHASAQPAGDMTDAELDALVRVRAANLPIPEPALSPRTAERVIAAAGLAGGAADLVRAAGDDFASRYDEGVAQLQSVYERAMRELMTNPEDAATAQQDLARVRERFASRLSTLASNAASRMLAVAAAAGEREAAAAERVVRRARTLGRGVGVRGERVDLLDVFIAAGVPTERFALRSDNDDPIADILRDWEDELRGVVLARNTTLSSARDFGQQAVETAFMNVAERIRETQGQQGGGSGPQQQQIQQQFEAVMQEELGPIAKPIFEAAINVAEVTASAVDRAAQQLDAEGEPVLAQRVRDAWNTLAFPTVHRASPPDRAAIAAREFVGDDPDARAQLRSILADYRRERQRLDDAWQSAIRDAERNPDAAAMVAVLTGQDLGLGALGQPGNPVDAVRAERRALDRRTLEDIAALLDASERAALPELAPPPPGQAAMPRAVMPGGGGS